MIGLGFIMRVLQIVSYGIVAIILLGIVITFVNFGIRAIAKIFGWNVGNFWQWLSKKVHIEIRKTEKENKK